MVETAWQALCSELGELPPSCKVLTHGELQFLIDSVKASDRHHEEAFEAAINHTLRYLPGVVRNTVRKIIFS